MNRPCQAWMLAIALVACATSATFAKDKTELAEFNAQIAGRVVDHTHNHGCDHRIWSESLQQKRDLYVYLPPGYDGVKQYPIIIWMHGLCQDEQGGLPLIRIVDKAIVDGSAPPVVMACPDGNLRGKPSYLHSGSFFLNSKAGNYEDFVIKDVWAFICEHYRIRPEREAHVLAGVSMGGFSAVNLAIKHRDTFHLSVGILPAVNMRYGDCNNNQHAPFDPNTYKLQDRYRPFASAGVNMHIHLRYFYVMHPLYHRPKEVERLFPKENPVEMLDPSGLKPGEVKFFLGYGSNDNFNVGAQVESFVYEMKRRGMGDDCSTVVIPKGMHDFSAAEKMIPALKEWGAPLLRPYAPQ